MSTDRRFIHSNGPCSGCGAETVDTHRSGCPGNASTDPTPDPSPSGLQWHLSRNVRERLYASGMTQVELARRTGITEKHLSQILNGREQGTLAMWDEIALSLGQWWRAEFGRAAVSDEAPADDSDGLREDAVERWREHREHPCAGACIGCGAGVDDPCTRPCRCDEGEDCEASQAIMAEAPADPLAALRAQIQALRDGASRNSTIAYERGRTAVAMTLAARAMVADDILTLVAAVGDRPDGYGVADQPEQG